MDNQTVGIIGAGHVGSHVAMSLVIRGICRRVMLIDTDEKKARAQADDLMDGLCHLPWPVEIKAGSYEDLKDAKETVETGWQIVLGKGSTEFGVASAAAAITRAILRGERGPKRDAVLLNGGAALYIGGKADSLKSGVELAAQLIDSGAADQKLDEFIKASQE